MGAFRFQVARHDRLPAFVTDVVHVTGFDRTPWQGTTAWESKHVLCHQRSVGESGAVWFPWVLPDGDWVTLCTATLRERGTPYMLERELARGTVSRCRELRSQMEAAGCPVAPDSDEQLATAKAAFVDHLSDGSNDLAVESLDRATAALNSLMADLRCFQQARRSEAGSPKFPLRVGNVVTPFRTPECERRFLEYFDSVSIPVRWREIERDDGKYDWQQIDRWVSWAEANGRRICMGPLIQLDRVSAPDWLFLLRDKPIEVVHQCVSDFIRACIRRYEANVDIWLSAAGLNLPNDLGLVSEERLRLAVTVIETVRHASRKRKPIVMRFSQPWSESLIRNEMELPAFHFADALIRADLGLRGVGLDIEWGYWPQGTLHRDPLAVHMMLQRWSALELPLLVGLAVPHCASVGERAFQRVLAAVEPPADAGELQAGDVRMLVATIASAAAVHGVAYNVFQDADSTRTPCAGLVDEHGEPRPAAREWTSAMESGAC